MTRERCSGSTRIDSIGQLQTRLSSVVQYLLVACRQIVRHVELATPEQSHCKESALLAASHSGPFGRIGSNPQIQRMHKVGKTFSFVKKSWAFQYRPDACGSYMRLAPLAWIAAQIT
jgi:hypothetical protein